MGATVRLNARGRAMLKRSGTVPVQVVVRLGRRTLRGPRVEVGAMPAKVYVRRVVGVLLKYGGARAELNRILDLVEAGTMSPSEGAARIRRDVLPRRRAALATVRALAPPSGMRSVQRLAVAAYVQSISAGTASASHLAAGGRPTNDPSSPLHVQATRTKNALLAALARQGRASGVRVPPARALWP